MPTANLPFLVRRKLKAKQLKWTGQRLAELIPVSVENAEHLSERYSGVQSKTFIERGPDATVRPVHLAEDTLQIAQPFKVACETVVLNITNPDFSFRNHVLVDGDLNVLRPELESREALMAFREYAPRNLVKVSGTVAYLSNTWVDNYYHWMQLTLPLIRLYRKADPNFAADYFYIGESFLQSVQVETLLRLGIKPNQILRHACRADRLIAAIYLHRPQHAGARYRDKWGHDFVRALYHPVKREPASPSRIYVGRGDARNRGIANESEVIQFLKAFGFVSVRMVGKSVAEQAKLFGNAEFIIGAHGAALTNLLFANQGAKLIEIIPSGREDSGLLAAAFYSGVEYSYLIADADQSGRIEISLSKLWRILEMNGV